MLVQQLPLTGDVTTIALGGHVLAHGADAFASDDLAADGRLNRDHEELRWNHFLQLLRELASTAFRLGAMHDAGECIDRFASDHDVHLHEIVGTVACVFVVHAAVAARHGLELVVEVHEDFVQWHDGVAFTADDVVFTAAYAADPASAAYTSGSYKDVKVTKVDSHTVKVEYQKPSPFWADPFVSAAGMLIPKHVFEPYKGATSRDAPANLKPVGTGPYKFTDFKPGDMLRGVINTNYHQPNRPYFDSIEMKGGGDAVSAARAVLQTGEYDYAWNLQVEDELLIRLEQGGKGKTSIVPGGNIEFIQLNMADPWTETDGERSHPKSKHPILSEFAVRQAISLCIDRDGVQKYIYGRTGIATANFLNNPQRFVSKNTKFEFNPEKAAQVLEAAGWKKGADGIREKGGKKLKLVFQTSINGPRQKTQQIIKQAAQKAGIDMELKSVPASVYFSSDPANPDTYTKLYADMQMFTTTMPQPDPEVFMNQYLSTEFASKANKWLGRNSTRYSNPEYDKTYLAAQSEMDPVKRAAMFVKMNDMPINDIAIIPVVYRPRTSAAVNNLVAPLSGWDNDLWLLQDWYKTT